VAGRTFDDCVALSGARALPAAHATLAQGVLLAAAGGALLAAAAASVAARRAARAGRPPIQFTSPR
jgi:hypothetical protein